MCKIVISFPNEENIDLYLEHDIDAFLIGIEDFSENFNRYVKIENLKDYCDLIISKGKKVFVCLNKMYFNSEMKKLKELLLLLDTLNLSGVMFCDISVLNIVEDNNLNIVPIWYGNHKATNSYTINFLEKRGVKGVLLSDEITTDEKINICEKINIKSFIMLFGYTNVATSSRELLTNYFKYTGMKKDSKDKYYIKEKSSDKFYPIIESGNTNFFSSKILNGIKCFPRIINSKKVDYIFLNDYMISSSSFYNVIEAFLALKKSPNDTEFVEKLYKVVDSNNYNNTDDGFLNKKTIFKVKNYE